MSDSTSTGKTKASVVLVAALIAWIMCFALSVVMAANTESSGDGFTRGINRTTVFLKWQAAALIVSVFSFFVARNKRNDLPKTLRFLGKTPLYAHCVILVFVAGVILYMFVSN